MLNRTIALAACAILAVMLVLGAPFVAMACVAALVAILLLLYRASMPPVFSFALGFQWLQVSLPSLIATIDQVPISDLVRRGDPEG